MRGPDPELPLGTVRYREIKSGREQVRAPRGS
jgi:hypothetical protein